MFGILVKGLPFVLVGVHSLGGAAWGSGSQGFGVQDVRVCGVKGWGDRAPSQRREQRILPPVFMEAGNLETFEIL